MGLSERKVLNISVAYVLILPIFKVDILASEAMSHSQTHSQDMKNHSKGSFLYSLHPVSISFNKKMPNMGAKIEI